MIFAGSKNGSMAGNGDVEHRKSSSLDLVSKNTLHLDCPSRIDYDTKMN